MIHGITEVGVAVRDLEAAIGHFRERLGAVPGPVQRFDAYGMEFCMCRVGNVDFELMAPAGEGGVIAQFLERYGEGLHHIGFAVDDIEGTQSELGARGLEFVPGGPRRQRFFMRDFAGREHDTEFDFTFSRPSSLEGVLLEFIQYPAGFALGAPRAAKGNA
jgi:methylmalonyl-CoA/ethylmalonyl-CoA epimerase